MSDSNSVLGPISAALLVVGGVLSLGLQLFYFPTDIETEDFGAAADFVLERFDPKSDVLRIHPNWREDALTHFQSIGKHVSRQSKPVFEDLYDHETIWLVAEGPLLKEGIERLPFGSSVKSKSIETFGPVKVAEIPVPDTPNIRYELRKNLENAVVQRLTPDEKLDETCENWDSNQSRWDCGSGDPWLWVGEEYMTLGEDAHRCIWAHPLPNQKILQIRFPEIPQGDRLWLRYGLNLEAKVSKRGTDVHVRAKAGDEILHENTVPADETSWKRQVLKLPGEQTSLTLQIHAKKVFERYFCINGWVVDSNSASQ